MKVREGVERRLRGWKNRQALPSPGTLCGTGRGTVMEDDNKTPDTVASTGPAQDSAATSDSSAKPSSASRPDDMPWYTPPPSSSCDRILQERIACQQRPSPTFVA